MTFGVRPVGKIDGNNITRHEMLESINNIMNNPIISLVSLILGFIGIFFAVYFYHIGKINKSLKYDISYFEIINNKVPKIKGFKASINNESLDDLILIKIAIWNDGNRTIKSDDISIKNPLNIIFDKETKILQKRVSITSNISNDISCHLSSDNIISIKFDFLDLQDGMVLEILASSIDDIKISGYIKGGGEVSNKKLQKETGKYQVFPKLLMIFTGIITSFMLIGFVNFDVINIISLSIIFILIVNSVSVLFIMKQLSTILISKIYYKNLNIFSEALSKSDYI